MKQTLLCLMLLPVLFSAAAASRAPAHGAIPPVSTVVTLGPGTVVSIRILDLPFVDKCYVVKYRTDEGRLVEIWHHGQLSVLPGMHGMLTYSNSPEMILQFRVVQR
jgi:hypothetical protein